jgi:hypothetical protein
VQCSRDGSAYEVTEGYHCGGNSIDPLEDGTDYVWT